MNSKVGDAWARISLRSKLTALSVAIIGMLLIISSAGTISLLRTYLQQNTDSVLINAAATLRGEDPSTIRLRIATRQISLPRLPSDYYIAFLDNSGSFQVGFYDSTSPNTVFPNVSNFTSSAVARTQAIPFEIDGAGKPVSDLNDGKGWRIIAVPLVSGAGSLVVALPVDNNNALLAQYRNIGTSFGFLLLLLSALAIWFTISSALKPLKEVERAAEAVAAGDITQRFLDHPLNTEVGRLNSALNVMMGSVEDSINSRTKALEQMRRFVSDASHELRTPLASVRGYAELYRMGALGSKEAMSDAMGRIESEAVRMGELVESLLALARLDEATKMNLVETNLVPMAMEAAKDASVAEYKRIVLVTNFEGEELSEDNKVVANVDAGAFRQVLINLLANASRFSPEDKPVELVLGRQGHKAVIEVRDHGEGIPKELREKVFERFFRADNSRNRETGGSGLGLSIVKTIVDRHRGTIVALETDGGGATFRVEL